ncbi:hypothetical protein AOC36_10145 [Erysipelothrix larvae]|uniref:Uncharacterized protein n=1 Tax=Erysipelothrix larvae TaxID=1514105 RepID=A0A0X8H1W0_9FIRM|nr:YhjD/YihY/BrkB family envelope integrity protein [Erysipelothrix larvae]AMC94319.1 hypothetical protein AOC36_10145 [Erysipelothrix larvae]
MFRKFMRRIIYAYKMVTSHEGRLFTYAFAYSLIIGIAPFLIVAVLLASRFWFNVDTIVNFMSYYIPEDLIIPFVTYIKTVETGDIVVIASLAVVSLWVASRTVYSFLLESSRVDSVGIENFVLRVAALLYLVFFILLVGAVVFVLSYFSLPIIPIITYFAVASILLMIFYRMMSFRFTTFQDVWIGGVFAGGGLLALGKLFFSYINDYTNYQSIYGPMASIMILLISVYMISWIVYAGYCLNISFYRGENRNDKKKWLERLAISGRNWLEGIRSR